MWTFLSCPRILPFCLGANVTSEAPLFRPIPKLSTQKTILSERRCNATVTGARFARTELGANIARIKHVTKFTRIEDQQCCIHVLLPN
ncbi:hypothetical protein OG21DRAFT_1515398 [Imleria badia]|nr:hypothetical protein OG21DRAFT_1515398 [Imleria badia]